MKTFECWNKPETEDDGREITLLPEDHNQHRMLTAGMSHVWSVRAETWEEATAFYQQVLNNSWM